MRKVRFGLVGYGAQGSSYSKFLTGRLGDAVPTEKRVPHGALGAVKKKSCILS